MKILNTFGLAALLLMVQNAALPAATGSDQDLQQLLNIKTKDDVAAYIASHGGQGLDAKTATTILQLKDAYQAALAGNKSAASNALESARKNIGMLQQTGTAGGLSSVLTSALVEKVEQEAAQVVAAVDLQKRQAEQEKAERSAAAQKKEEDEQDRLQEEKIALAQSAAQAEKKAADETIEKLLVAVAVVKAELAAKDVDLDEFTPFKELVDFVQSGTARYVEAVAQKALGQTFDATAMAAFEEKVEMLKEALELLAKARLSGQEAEKIAKDELAELFRQVVVNKERIDGKAWLQPEWNAPNFLLIVAKDDDLINLLVEKYEMSEKAAHSFLAKLVKKYISSEGHADINVYLQDNFKGAFYATLEEFKNKLFINILPLAQQAFSAVKDFRETTLAHIQTVLTWLESTDKEAKVNVEDYLQELKKEWGAQIMKEKELTTLALFTAQEMLEWLQKKYWDYANKEQHALISGWWKPGGGWNKAVKRKGQIGKLYDLIWREKMYVVKAVPDAPKVEGVEEVTAQETTNPLKLLPRKPISPIAKKRKLEQQQKLDYRWIKE